MKLSEFKNQLGTLKVLNFVLPTGQFVPRHFHITEAGLVTKHFIDCGGTVRVEKSINFQLWVAGDVEHRLEPKKLAKIIDLASPLFGNEDLDIEVEYQGDTIGKYGVATVGENFLLTAKKTNCLAQDSCGISPEKLKVNLAELTSASSGCCTPGGGCC